MADISYNREGKRGHEQIVIELLVSQDGCPVGVSVYRDMSRFDSRISASPPARTFAEATGCECILEKE